MRVRLYEVGAATVGVMLIDEFPASLELGENGEVLPRCKSDAGVCRLEDIGGQLVLRTRAEFQELAVNDAPLEEGPLMPGDRLRLGNHQYLVSYEQTTLARSYPQRFRIQK